MSEEEIEERLEELKELKIPPREREENKLLLSRAERLYEKSVGEIRQEIDSYIRQFENILDKQDRTQIEKVAKELKSIFDEIDHDVIY